MILVTGACGFIGSNFVLDWLAEMDEPLIALDKLTYASNLTNLESVKNHPLFTFVKGDINDRELIDHLLQTFKPRAILNFAAETHVDRSIKDPHNFIYTNINGTFHLLEASRQYWSNSSPAEKSQFRFLQISTDEVFGSLEAHDEPFTELSHYAPNNPYSASKAAADYLVRSYYHTYQFPVLTTHCSNNYGPFQFYEKLIPFTLINALQNKPLLIYGDGLQVRDWLYVTDHCSAIRKVLAESDLGETYNIGGRCEKTNLEVVNTICQLLDQSKPKAEGTSYTTLITHISDRPGHDRRYAINADKIKEKLGWLPAENFASGIKKTVQWYLDNLTWVKENDQFQQWLAINYTQRDVA